MEYISLLLPLLVPIVGKIIRYFFIAKLMKIAEHGNVTRFRLTNNIVEVEYDRNSNNMIQ